MMNFEDSKICGVSASEESLDRVDILLNTLDLNPYEKWAYRVGENSSFASSLGNDVLSQIGFVPKRKNFSQEIGSDKFSQVMDWGSSFILVGPTKKRLDPKYVNFVHGNRWFK